MDRVDTIGSQALSARRCLMEAEVGHNEKALVSGIIGVSPQFPDKKELQTLHFCSASLTKLDCLQEGDDTAMPLYSDKKIVVHGGLAPVPAHGFVQMRFVVLPNGALNFRPIGPMRFVAISEDLLEETSWSKEGGAQSIAKMMGYDDIHQLFAKQGNLLEV